jgi:hypothetical protein
MFAAPLWLSPQSYLPEWFCIVSAEGGGNRQGKHSVKEAHSYRFVPLHRLPAIDTFSPLTIRSTYPLALTIRCAGRRGSFASANSIPTG